LNPAGYQFYHCYNYNVYEMIDRNFNDLFRGQLYKAFQLLIKGVYRLKNYGPLVKQLQILENHGLEIFNFCQTFNL